MSLPYQNTRSGDKAMGEIQKIVRGFGCSKFGSGNDFDTGDLFIQFEYKGQMIHMKANAKGYAAAWLKENPWTYRRNSTRAEWESKALSIGNIAVYSILRDWVKGQVTAIEIGVMTFEAAFLSHIMLPSGRRVIDEITEHKMLPQLELKDNLALSGEWDHNA